MFIWNLCDQHNDGKKSLQTGSFEFIFKKAADPELILEASLEIKKSRSKDTSGFLSNMQLKQYFRATS